MLNQLQLEERRSYLGGSDIAAVFGISPYMTRYELWENKVHGIEKEKSEDVIEMLRICSLQEEVVAKAYEYRTGNKVRKHAKPFHKKEWPWLGGNVDRIIENEPGILECKTSHYMRSDKFGEEWTDQIPKEYLCQVALYCLLGDFEYCDIAVLIGGNQLVCYKYKRDFTLEKEIVNATRDFWYNYVLKGTPPPITHQDDIDRIFKTIAGKEVEASENIALLVKEYKKISDKVKDLASKKEEMLKLIKIFMGDGEQLTYLGEPIATNKSFQRKSISAEALKKTYPKIYNNILKQSPYKRFSIAKGIDNVL